MNEQKGFTLVELMVTISIIGFISVAGALTYNTVTGVSSNTSEQSMIMSQVNQAGDWISRDVQSAVTVEAGSEGNWHCFISRKHWNGTDLIDQTIEYVFVENKLYRQVNGGDRQLIARYLTNPGIDTKFMVSSSDNNTFVLNVKAMLNATTFSQKYIMNKRIIN